MNLLTIWVREHDGWQQYNKKITLYLHIVEDLFTT